MEIQEKQSYKHKRLQAKVLISSFVKDGMLLGKNITSFIPLPSLEKVQHANYQISGTLEQKRDFFIFTPIKEATWKGLGADFCLPKARLICKLFLAKQISKLYPTPTVHHFLTAITLGVLDNPLLRFCFGKLGLQHILAISGFHFAILSLCVGFALRLLLPRKLAIYSLIFLLTLYFLLLGTAPSILRAYLATILYLIGSLMNVRPRAINLLSAALILELLIAPTSVVSLGFQLSFLATAAILFLCPLVKPWIDNLLPRRPLQRALRLPSIEKPIYLICSALRPILTVNIAVFLVILPASLYYFSTFPLSSLLFNLFIPLCVTLSISLFLLALSLFFLPSLSHAIHNLNELFTHKVLDVLVQSPNQLDYTLSSPPFPEIFLYGYILLIFVISIKRQNKFCN